MPRHPARESRPGWCTGASAASSWGSIVRGTRCSRPRSWPPAPTCFRWSRFVTISPGSRSSWTRPPARGSRRRWPSSPSMSTGASLYVEAPARLHFGVLDLRGALGRRFGGLGAAIPSPSLLIEVAPSRGGITAEGPDAERAAEFARRFLEHHRVRDGARVVVHRPIPAHSGLGSGTQLRSEE